MHFGSAIPLSMICAPQMFSYLRLIQPHTAVIAKIACPGLKLMWAAPGTKRSNYLLSYSFVLLTPNMPPRLPFRQLLLCPIKQPCLTPSNSCHGTFRGDSYDAAHGVSRWTCRGALTCSHIRIFIFSLLSPVLLHLTLSIKPIRWNRSRSPKPINNNASKHRINVEAH